MTRNQFGSNPTRVRIPPAAPRRSKVRFAPTSFYACGKKDVIRPLPCSSFPTATRCAGLAVGGPPCGRHFSPLRNIDFNRPFPVGAKFALLRGLFISGAKKMSSARFLTPSFQLGPTLLSPQLVCCPTGGVLRSRHTTHWERGRQTNAKEGRSFSSFPPLRFWRNLPLRSPTPATRSCRTCRAYP